jgi:hypothetical protein
MVVQDYGIVPDSRAVEYVENIRRKGNGKARMHVRMHEWPTRTELDM